MDDITCPLLMTSHALYMTCHLLCMISHSLYVWHHTLDVSLTSQTLCLWHTTLYGITHSVMTTQPLCTCTATMFYITPTASVSSHTVDHIYQMQCVYDITATMCMTSYALHVTSHPQFSTSHHFMYDIRSILSDLTSTVSLLSHPPYQWYHSTVCMNSHPVDLWHHLHYIYDMISTKYDVTTLCVDEATLSICMTSFALQMKTHPLYLTKPQYLWCHIHFRHDNTAPVSDIAPLYLCHHTFSTDISPTFVWHHTHLLCDIIWTINNITPNPCVIILLYLWHHSLCIWNHIQYEGNIHT